ncbi:MAG: hypothetical protein BGO49_01585 [Planctomycetales bacterium 71-10]|nr:MAG: hypothetical protein BGO49_01585 [Planctomycetales bacterium 71-10]
MNPAPSSPVGWRKPTVRALKAVVAVLVFAFVARHVHRTWGELGRSEAALTFRPGWFALSGAAYLAGLALCGAFYRDVLGRSPTPISRFAAQRAYLVSHLGKYVPGKAVVVVMRAALSKPYGARASTSAVATFYETLVMMASGALIAAVLFASGGESPVIPLERPVLGLVEIRSSILFAMLSAGMGGALLTLVWPPVFRRAARTLLRKIPGVDAGSMPDLDGSLLARGLALTGVSWLFLGLSQVAAAKGLAGAGSPEIGPAAIPVATASVALATVAGFAVAIAPGGLGVREGVLMYALGPAFGPALATASALALRLAWVAAEVLAALVLVPMGAAAPGKVPAAEAIQEAVPISEAP